ncbi:MAG: lysine exporter LysO family protein [Peptostreptococcaceae bacterium]|nr:lysine exporter LysO family protein [Peptostreptococcaceae bacterium]
MFMTIMPFACLTTGLVLGLLNMPNKFYSISTIVTNVALVFLMVTIGANVGINDDVMSNLDTIGLNCILICLLAISFSVFFCYIVEKKLINFNEISKKLKKDEIKEQEKRSGIDPILIVIPFSILAGVGIGYYLIPSDYSNILNNFLVTSLILLYTSVGIGMGSNIGVFKFIKEIGFKIIYLVIAIYIGSALGGAVASLITGVPLKYAVISASGLGYYSLTGATMMQFYGAEAGVYGFMVNVMRDFFTVILIPIFVRISPSAPMASGAGGNMDTLLVPVTKAVGKELGGIALVIGVVITLLVPIILPILCAVM